MLLHSNRLTAAEQERCLEILLAEIQAYRAWLPLRWGQLGHDALDDALGFVWLKIQAGLYDPALGEFRPWCRQVLQRLLFGHGRRAQRLTRRGLRASGEAGDAAACGPPAPLAREDFDTVIRRRELARFTTARFSAADLRRVSLWTPLDRVVLLGLAGLWNKVPPPIGQQWWAGVAGPRGLAAAPPLAKLGRCATPQQRLPVLASALGIKTNTLAARWMRRKDLLAELACIQDLGITPAELAKRQPRKPQWAEAAC